jgi:hypothetical protein
MTLAGQASLLFLTLAGSGERLRAYPKSPLAVMLNLFQHLFFIIFRIGSKSIDVAENYDKQQQHGNYQPAKQQSIQNFMKGSENFFIKKFSDKKT